MEFLIIIGLIILNGVLAMSEIAMVSARKSRLETEAKSGNKSAQRALKLANQPDRFLSTIQIGIVNRYPYRSLLRTSPRRRLGRMGGKNKGIATSRITNIQNAYRDRRDLPHADFRGTRTQTHRNGRCGKNGKTNCRPDGYSFPYSLTFRVVTLCQHVIHDETIGIE